jgi:phosphoglycolate phosphatase
MIGALADDYDLYVLSNKPHDATIREIELQGLGGAFRRVWGAGSLPALKPDPAGVLEALRLSGVGAERGAMVGDMPVDVATAAAARVFSFLATWGFRPSTATAGGAVVAVGSPSQVAAEVRRAIPARP